MNTTLEINGVEFETEIDYTYYPEELPSQFSPGEDDYVEIHSVIVAGNRCDWMLDNDEFSKLIEDECLEDFQSQVDESAYDRYCDDKFDMEHQTHGF